MQQISLKVLEDILQRELPKNEKGGNDALNYYLDLSNWKYGVLKLDKITTGKDMYDNRYTFILKCITPQETQLEVEDYDVSGLISKLYSENKDLLENNSNILNKLIYLTTVRDAKHILFLYDNYFTKSEKSIKLEIMYFLVNDSKPRINLILLYKYKGTKRYMKLYNVYDLATEIDEEIERIGR
jgi:hypothetical protein